MTWYNPIWGINSKQMQKASLPPSMSEMFFLLPLHLATAFGDLDPMIIPAINEKNYLLPRHLPFFKWSLGWFYKVKNQNITPWMQGSVYLCRGRRQTSAVWICQLSPPKLHNQVCLFWVKNDDMEFFQENYLSLQGLPGKHDHFFIDVYLI